jgi:hypothetical protein
MIFSFSLLCSDQHDLHEKENKSYQNYKIWSFSESTLKNEEISLSIYYDHVFMLFSLLNLFPFFVLPLYEFSATKFLEIIENKSKKSQKITIFTFCAPQK